METKPTTHPAGNPVVDKRGNQMSEELERALAAAAKRLGVGTNNGGAGTEKAYGAAYQALVRAGVRPQLRAKYRAG